MVGTEALKLNLGSRDRIARGFKNMDIEVHSGVDFVGDVSDLSRFASDSVAEIFASNILEHFPHRATLNVLKEWCRVLAPGGKLYISVPDFDRSVELYRKTGYSQWLENFICGDQGYATAFHYAIFTEMKLRDLCAHAGFSIFERINGSFSFTEDKDCSNLHSTVDSKPVCLNAVVTK